MATRSEGLVWFYGISTIVGWVLWQLNPLGYFIFLFIIFVRCNLYVYSYLYIVLFWCWWYLFIAFSLELSAEVSISDFLYNYFVSLWAYSLDRRPILFRNSIMFLGFIFSNSSFILLIGKTFFGCGIGLYILLKYA